MSIIDPATQPLTRDVVLDDLRGMLAVVLDQYGADVEELAEIGEHTLFHDDLGLESIDLVAVGALLAERYGEQVNLAAHLAEFELDEVIGLRIGVLVELVMARTGH
ncbi:phosphopantetheine-binding protein [Actinokineospora guangxiensis]|uniref:Phosphopantetheine-binding protein n=1 Tax=Actinokineospora guangxiensis TaxID=1490288 RepID=A0ABW0EPR9_9PSEU